MSLLDIIGIAAGTLTTLSFLPQVIKAWRSKSVKDISLGMYAIFSLGLALWIMYGVIVRSIPIIAANSATLGLAGVIIFLKLKHDE